ncbi:uncharacterized protein [Choristoneura fumiferana]|uniref:uncharacterized protein n=1 Tax=Choristoneura fumiferana TaxID=7141 RepID=UPI003D15EF54
MADSDAEQQNQKRRRLKTPKNMTPRRVSEEDSSRRDRSRSRSRVERRSRSRSRNRSRTVRTRNNKSQGREHELLSLRAKLEMLERELKRDRESRARSRLPGSRRDSSRSRSRYRNKERDDPQRSGISRDGEQRQRRSSSHNFSSEDVAKIVNSIKNNTSSHPPTCTTLNKTIDHKNILPNFDPSSKNQRIGIWLKKVNECAAVYGWDDKTTIHFAMQKLQGLAKVWYESLDTILFSWAEWQEKLINAFPCEENYGQSLEEMLKRKSKFNEPIEVYYYEKLALVHQCGISGKKAVDCIIHGITEKTTKSSAVAVRCSNPDQLLQFLISNKDAINQDRVNIMKHKHWTDNSANNQSTKNRAQPQGPYCFNCKEKGHHFLQCPKPLLKCHHCNKVGHKAETCFRKPDNKSVKTPEVRSLCLSGTGNSKFFKNANVNGVLAEVFVDFGSEVTLVKESFIASLGVCHNQIESVMKGFGNGLVKSLGGVWLDFDIDGVKAKVPCKVVEDDLLDKAILVGQSFTELPHIIVYKDLTQLRFMDIGNEMPQPQSSHASVVKVSIAKDVELYGPASIKAFTDDSFSGSVLIRERLIGKPGQQFVLCGGMYTVNNGIVNIVVTPCCSPCLIMENFAVCRVERVASINRITMQSPTTVESIEVEDITESKLRIGDNVSESHKHRLLQLLNKYKHCFAAKLGELGCTNVTQMTIDLNDERPIASRPYRLSHHEREQVRSMIDEMLKAGIIRDSTSEYASPIILVRKPDGGLRMCIDYRKLNSVTVKERYPMPIIDDEIARLSGQAYFITLDLASGYYQVPIAERSKHLTSFVTPDVLTLFRLL